MEDQPSAGPSREARILPPDQQSKPPGKKHGSRENGSAPNSNGDGTESGGNNGNSSGSGAIMSPSDLASAAEQRPTRLKDLDPDRVQVPSENMYYIRHLGLVPPELLADATQAVPDVNPDSEGWVYLNLLCNLAQLHMVNVTPSFVRLAVSEISTNFQLSPDGNRIRWRGGSEGTRFSSDSSGNNSQRSPDTDGTMSSGKAGARKAGDGQVDGPWLRVGQLGQEPAQAWAAHVGVIRELPLQAALCPARVAQRTDVHRRHHVVVWARRGEQPGRLEMGAERLRRFQLQETPPRRSHHLLQRRALLRRPVGRPRRRVAGDVHAIQWQGPARAALTGSAPYATAISLARPCAAGR